MKVLSLDSATEVATCAVIEDNKILGEVTFNYKKQHSVILMPMIDYLLKSIQLDLKSIDGFAVSKGPGSFTGLRIGLATIKGLSQGTKKPFIGVSSLDALAYNLAYTSGIICPILDALRDNVYTAFYTFTNNKLERISEYMAISIEDVISMLKEKKQPICFVGDGVPLHHAKLSEELDFVSFAPAHLNIVKASALGEIGMELLQLGMQDDLYNSAPLYLRKSQAEREYEKKMGLTE